MPFYEIGSAFLCSSLISPVMTVMDTSIIRSQYENISLSQSYKKTIRNYTNGSVKCLRPLMIMNSVYFSTYATANLTGLYYPDDKMTMFLATSLVNILGITYKDKEYIRLFENKVLKFPWKSYTLFALRDSLTIGSTFVVKKDMVKILHHEYGFSYNMADFISSSTIPILAQLFSTPLHIMALELHQKPVANIHDRISRIYQLYPSVCFGRMMRILPAFCFGSYLNDILRSKRYFNDD